MSRANDGITFSVAHLLAIFNVTGSLADQAAVVRDLSAPVSTTRVAFASGLLAAKVVV